MGNKKNPGGRPRKWTDQKVLQDQVDNYFKMCDQTIRFDGDKEIRKPYTMSGMSIFLDCDTDTINEYMNGVYDDDNNKFSVTLKNARKKVENYAEEQLYSNKNTAGIIFNLKNNFGWKDKQEVDMNISNIEVNLVDPEDD